MIRSATHDDVESVMRLYRQLNPDDPIVDDDTARTTFGRILDDPSLFLLVLESDGTSSPRPTSTSFRT